MRTVRILARTLAIAVAVASNVGGQWASAVTSEYAGRPHGWGWAIMFVTLGVVFAGCAACAWVLLPAPATGWAMVGCSFFWSVGSWYALSRPSGWAWPPIGAAVDFWEVFVGLVVLLYPSGRMASRLDRWIIGAASILYGVRFVTEIFIFSATPAANCGCAPSNWVLLPYPEMDGITGTGWRIVAGILVVFIAVRVCVRWFTSSLPARRVSFVMPLALLLFMYSAIQEATAYLFGLQIPEWLQFLPPIVVTSLPLSFIAGIAYTRGLRSRVADLVIVARDRVDRMLWESSLAKSLRDPSLRVFWRDDALGGYYTSDGTPVVGSPQPTDGRSSLLIGTEDAPLAVIEHDIALLEDQRLLDAVSSALLLSVDNDRLRQRLETTLHEVRESRLRIVEASYEVRRNIERDLHDGSQQLLVSLAIGLRIATAKAEREGSPDLADDLRRASAQLADALRELRELARGIHPSVLSDGDLSTAISELTLRSTLDVEAEIDVDVQLPVVVRETIYFVVAECLTNSAKYSGANSARVRLRRVDNLVLLSVSDDGVGGAVLTDGGGLGGLRDRVEAVDGAFALHSSAASGTTVEATIPVPAAGQLPEAPAEPVSAPESASTDAPLDAAPSAG